MRAGLWALGKSQKNKKGETCVRLFFSIELPESKHLGQEDHLGERKLEKNLIPLEATKFSFFKNCRFVRSSKEERERSLSNHKTDQAIKILSPSFSLLLRCNNNNTRGRAATPVFPLLLFC